MKSVACPFVPALEEVRAIAQLGLHYTKDAFDRERFLKLLALVAQMYSNVSEFPAEKILDCFGEEIGHITPKVGANGAVFDEEGALFLTRRADDKLWEIPGGWVEVNESPEQALSREFIEETSSHIAVGQIITVMTRRAGDFGQPHSSCHLVFHCSGQAGLTSPTEEVLDAGYFSDFATLEWHRDHRKMAERACDYWNRLQGP